MFSLHIVQWGHGSSSQDEVLVFQEGIGISQNERSHNQPPGRQR